MNLPPINKMFKANTILAILTFSLKKILPFESHLFYKMDLPSLNKDKPAVAPEYSFARITSANHPNSIDPQVEQKLNLNAGTCLKKRLARGEQAFLLFYKTELACQLFMSHNSTKVDSPIPLSLEYGDDSWFLSFLYTHHEYRDKGMAQKLMHYTCKELKNEGYSRCLAHIRSTNLASINSFEKAGWKKIATLYSVPAKSRFFKSNSLTKNDIKVSAIS